MFDLKHICNFYRQSMPWFRFFVEFELLFCLQFCMFDIDDELGNKEELKHVFIRVILGSGSSRDMGLETWLIMGCNSFCFLSKRENAVFPFTTLLSFWTRLTPSGPVETGDRRGTVYYYYYYDMLNK